METINTKAQMAMVTIGNNVTDSKVLDVVIHLPNFEGIEFTEDVNVLFVNDSITDMRSRADSIEQYYIEG